MNRRRTTPGDSDGATPAHLASSFTDLMASLMVIFILLFVATISNTFARQKASRDTTIEKLLGALKSALAAGGIAEGGIRRDERDPYAVVVVMPEDLLFKRGDSSVGPKGQQWLATFVPRMAEIACGSEYREKVETVVVEGHTDSVWAATGNRGADGPQLNLELSQRRSMDVVRWSLDALPLGEQRDCFRGLLSASGRGQEEPLPDVPTDDSQQRRVVLKIRTEQESLADVTKALAGVAGRSER